MSKTGRVPSCEQRSLFSSQLSRTSSEVFLTSDFGISACISEISRGPECIYKYSVVSYVCYTYKLKLTLCNVLIHFYLIYWYYACVSVCTHATVCMWRSQDKGDFSSPSFLHSEACSQLVRLVWPAPAEPSHRPMT